jgi:hypothetical protein
MYRKDINVEYGLMLTIKEIERELVKIVKRIKKKDKKKRIKILFSDVAAKRTLYLDVRLEMITRAVSIMVLNGYGSSLNQFRFQCNKTARHNWC